MSLSVDSIQSEVVEAWHSARKTLDKITKELMHTKYEDRSKACNDEFLDDIDYLLNILLYLQPCKDVSDTRERLQEKDVYGLISEQLKTIDTLRSRDTLKLLELHRRAPSRRRCILEEPPLIVQFTAVRGHPAKKEILSIVNISNNSEKIATAVCNYWASLFEEAVCSDACVKSERVDAERQVYTLMGVDTGKHIVDSMPDTPTLAEYFKKDCPSDPVDNRGYIEYLRELMDAGLTELFSEIQTGVVSFPFPLQLHTHTHTQPEKKKRDKPGASLSTHTHTHNSPSSKKSKTTEQNQTDRTPDRETDRHTHTHTHMFARPQLTRQISRQTVRIHTQ
eukprot:GHVR01109845.1.p1 GENE.GHVR01109845.1~~GHVR01109845.1.p1  ORF type:complete len:336 (-),score=125.23 GHVR01109845.1:135-1142(-)